jgi:hypothetical protein
MNDWTRQQLALLVEGYLQTLTPDQQHELACCYADYVVDMDHGYQTVRKSMIQNKRDWVKRPNANTERHLCKAISDARALACVVAFGESPATAWAVRAALDFDPATALRWTVAEFAKVVWNDIVDDTPAHNIDRAILSHVAYAASSFLKQHTKGA